MAFSSISFLYIFLPVVLLAYFVVPKRFKNAVLLVSSLVFYFFGEPVYTLLLVISSLTDYFHGIGIEKHRGTKKAKALLVSSIAINLLMLGFFKYTDFIIGNVNAILSTDIPLTKVSLPIGISFFTFQTMSYTIDVYRGRVHADKSIQTFATYVCLFPQLVAGPIVRYSEVSKELHERKTGLDDLYQGVCRFVVGMGKKVFIANAMGELCGIFRASGEKSVAFYWLYGIAFTLQIYYDFSGYSDMAIGLGRMFGFKFPENFDYPFISKSITEFWRRWHMTLGSWFRDYLYIPLGGNRRGRGRWFVNIVIVWLVTGMWHGAAWNFAVWGLIFGLLLILEKLKLIEWLEKSGKTIPHIYVMLLIITSFVIFNAEGVGEMISDLGGLFGAGRLPLWSFETGYYLKSYALVIVLAAIGSTPLPKKLWQTFAVSKTGAWISLAAEPFYVLAIMLTAMAFLVDGSFNPFLYFKF